MKTLAKILLVGALACNNPDQNIDRAFYEDRIKTISSIETNLDTELITTMDDTLKFSGRGFVVGNYLLSLDHVVSKYKISQNTFFGRLDQKLDRKSETTYLEGIELCSVAQDSSKDMAIFDLSKTPELKKYTNYLSIDDLMTKKDVYVGMGIYYNGNPYNLEDYYNEGIVRKLDEKNAAGPFGNSFLISEKIIGGTSGTPVWNGKQIVGIAQYEVGGIGGVKYLDEYIKKIKEYEK